LVAVILTDGGSGLGNLVAGVKPVMEGKSVLF